MMDRDAFDGLVRLLAAKPTRRAALGALLGTALAGAAGLAAGKGKRRARGKDRRRVRAAQIPSSCCSTNTCAPGGGRNLTKCCYPDQDLRGRNFRGANLTSATFAEADLRGADFRGANLSKACFADADLTGATLGSSVNLGGAIFCNTTMPDGSIDDRGCSRGTACCPTCLPATCESLGVQCGAWPDGCGGRLECGRCPLGDTPVCDTGICVRCDALCDCGSCLTFATGDAICDAGAFGECGEPCASNADCTDPDLPACVVSLTDRITNETTTLASVCGPPVTVGACTALVACGP